MNEMAVRHEDLVVVDGLVQFSDGDAAPLIDGGVAAVNLTVVSPLADLTQAIDETAKWLRILQQEQSPWRLVLSADDIPEARQARKAGLIMGWQNMRPIGDNPDRIRLFHALGTRIMQLTYNEANFIGDGCLEDRGSGLTRFGHDVVSEMNAVGVAVDVSHCSEQTGLDATKISKKPVLLTHANAKAVAKRPRNKSDEVLRATAQTGGTIGISVHGFMNWNGNPKEPPSLEGFVAQVRHVASVAGYDHVAIGNDFASVKSLESAKWLQTMSVQRYPGAAADYAAAFGNTLEKRFPAETPSPREMGRITLALAKSGITDRQIEGIMGQNLLRALREVWH
jgi:membrane dipeptidase